MSNRQEPKATNGAKRRSWKCPECGYNKLYPYKAIQLWSCHRAYSVGSGCGSMFKKKTIQALVAPHSAMGGLYKASLPPGAANYHFTVSPPGFLMPWEQLTKAGTEGFTESTTKCECGGEVANTTHSHWCSKWQS